MKLWITLLLGTVFSVNATTINAPYSGSNVFDGNKAYKWAFGITVPSDQVISSATLSFSNIKLTVANSSGHGYLYSDLLNVGNASDHTYTDYDHAGDFFDSYFSSSSRVDLGTKYFASVGTTLSWSYDFTADQLAKLSSFASDTYLAFGFDPDCHYNVGCISFEYQTTSRTPPPSVPDGGKTLAFLGLGLISLAGLKRMPGLCLARI